jgi:UDP-N-acetylglucosamine 2-epimerase
VTRKVCVVITARPSYSRIRSVLEAIRERPELELQLVVAASALLDRYGNTWKVIENEGYRIDRRVYMVLEGENLVTSAKSTGLGMAELATVFDHLRPHAVVTVGDRYETIATAVAATYLNIPLVHIQGGEITSRPSEPPSA